MACKCCHCDSSSESNTSNNSSASTSTGLISNDSMTLEEVKKALWMKYGIMIELRSLDEINDIYYLDRKYVFYRNKMLYKHVKEFTCYLKDILYRNYYWINSPYKMNAIYDNIRDDIRKGGYSKNTKYYIPISMDDGHNIKFYPDYVNFENNHFYIILICHGLLVVIYLQHENILKRFLNFLKIMKSGLWNYTLKELLKRIMTKL